jgi:hypothetical protein
MAVTETTTATAAVTAPADPRLDQLEAMLRQKLEMHTAVYRQKFHEKVAAAEQRAASAAGTAEIAGPVTPGGFFVPSYQWFDLLAAGPFQPTAPGGPFEPSRVVRAGEDAVLYAVVWRNPVPLAGGPSAAQIMAPFEFRIRGETTNLTSVTNGPDLGPVTQVFGAGFINVVAFSIPSLPPPPDGRPTLLEINLTIDVLGPGVGLPPFAGFATRWYQPDFQPSFLGLGDITPAVLNEVPCRVMIYS